MTQCNEKGFSLVEVLIYTALFGVIVVVLIEFNIVMTDLRQKSYVAEQVASELRLATDIMTKQIREAAGIQIASSTFALDPGVLSLETNLASTTPTVFSLDGDDGRLQITQGSTAAVTLTANTVNITKLVFNTVSASTTHPVIQIVITGSFNADGGQVYDVSQTITTTAVIRE